jgi:hypothetical protein
MIPKLTDEAIAMLPLESGRAELLEEIMTTVAPDRQTETLSNPAPRRTRWLAPLAAAAVVAGLAGGTLWWQEQRPGPQQALSVSAALGLAEGQRVTLEAPGWDADSLGDGLRFRNGDAQLEITSYAAKDYDSYVTDREHIKETPVEGQPIQVLGRPALMWAYSATDHTAIREVEHGRWLEIRASGVDQAGYLTLLGDLRVVSSAAFDAALPDDFVTTAERPDAAQKIIGDIQGVSGAGFPAGASLELGEGDAKDSYQFGAEVAGAYACAWFEAFENASTHDQQAAATEAARVLGTSRQWPILKEMNADGGYPDVLWELADQVATGQVPDWYREGLGC